MVISISYVVILFKIAYHSLTYFKVSYLPCTPCNNILIRMTLF